MKRFWTLIGAILLCEFIGILGSFVTYPSISTWYATLSKPFFSPPNWVFGPVWTTLYAMMGISLFLVWEKGLKKRKIREALILFFIQLGLNFLWSFVFFGLQSLIISVVVIVLLWISIVLTIYRFWTISKLSSYLLIPYILWVSFASLLNVSIFLLNK